MGKEAGNQGQEVGRVEQKAGGGSNKSNIAVWVTVEAIRKIQER